MAATTYRLAQRIAISRDQTESEWLNAFEFLRSALSHALTAHAHIGCYYIDDFRGHASAGGYARIRGRTPVPGINSDSWEGVLCWSGNRDSRAHASALIFPFLDASAVQPEGRIADLGAGTEVDRFLLYRFEDGVFNHSGWHCGDGPGVQNFHKPTDWAWSSAISKPIKLEIV